MENLNMSIGSVLKDRRIALNIKQEDIAEQLGLTVQTVSKWERDLTEPKASQVTQLSKILKLAEKDICSGEVKHLKMDPLEFVRRVGILMNEVPQTELLIGMHEYINDTDGFINMLARVSDYPYELLEMEYEHNKKENEKFHARMSLKLIEEHGHEPYGSVETMEKVKKHAMEVLGITEVSPDVRS
ncbi:helix-turn-helix transcriptional regulator [Shewanella baltica]|uniref:helix-turn-helix domain-containing protein n=1 Tax=Shewanella baltica TaxID=62322 RepID=UPI00217ECA8A|nr:helix-turn-helix transcriptional regulator [Shewanella baltica]MCS6155326.1 helix-turn-helix transcriptional regulator [Shewanella baltica]